MKLKHFRTVMISDLHLGSSGCNADLLLAFLRSLSCETLILIGDTIDYECRRTMKHWTTECSHVLNEIVAIGKEGTRVLYVPGNHDDYVKAFEGERVLGAYIYNSKIYELIDGRRALLVHGDELGVVTQFDGSQIASVLGRLFDQICRVSRWASDRLKSFGLGPVMIGYWLKSRSKIFWRALQGYEKSLVAEAKRWRCDAVICGHIHVPDMKTIDDVLYLNTGDWLENCSAIAECHDGSLRLLRVAKA